MNNIKNFLAGGTNSPIPYPSNYPRFIVKGKDQYVYDEEGNEYIDMWMGYGALILGHANDRIIEAVNERVSNGHFFSYPTLLEVEIAEMLHNQIPCAELVRFSTSGSDAVAYALRAARAYTNRKKVLSLVGGYHGVHENMIPSKGTISTPEYIIDFVKFNDIDEARDKLNTKEYACFILEPVMANSGCTVPEDNYLQRVRDLCTETETVLIFDEVVTGFRLSPGGAQQYFNVVPDLATFSKAIANGFPLSAVCGKKPMMEQFMPVGNTFFAGTFNGSPISLTSAKVVQSTLIDEDIHQQINTMGDEIRSFIKECIDELNLNACVQGIGSMFTIAFGCKEFKHGLKASGFSSEKYEEFIKLMAEKKILFPPLQSETVFLSMVHKESIDYIKKSIKESLYAVK